MFELATEWMNGVQLYLRDSPALARGHIACMNAPWKISCILQAQFWARDFAATYGDGRARDCLSTIVSDWNTPGVLFGKPARDCTGDEIVREVWAQLKRHLNVAGATLTDDLLLSASIDRGLMRRRGRLVSKGPLVLPRVGAGSRSSASTPSAIGAAGPTSSTSTAPATPLRSSARTAGCPPRRCPRSHAPEVGVGR